jgi:hypothetical protein
MKSETYVPPEKYRPKPRDPNRKPEKVWGCTLWSFLALLGVFVGKYVVDFLLMPMLFPALFPFSVGAVVVWVITTLIFTIIAMKFVSGLIYFYYAADLVYAILTVIWSFGLYGAEYVTGIGLAVIMAIVLYFIQRLVLWAMILLSFVKM